MSVMLLERDPVLGGQAGTSSRIENYLGFDNGVSGADLTKRACDQARRLGAELRTEHQVALLSHQEGTGYWVSECTNGEQHVAPAVLAAVGVDYRRLNIPGGDSPHVFYGASHSDHEACFGTPVVVIGGGNSAGQAVLNLHKHGAQVTMVVRRSLRETMSRYLIERIVKARIPVLVGAPEIITPEHVAGDRIGILPASHVYAYIGMEPRTEFLAECCDTDNHGFILTEEFQASAPGLFVAGDVRSGSRKRVAVATGEGAIAAADIWRFINA
jgi:thioredoxin reductase (NADPH)